MQFLLMTLLLMTGVFLILLVLVQRGRGGGLTGALGGMGGQSAFGSKAGDLFTRITIGVAGFWIVLSVASIKILNTSETVFGDTEQTTFDDGPVPSLSTDAPEDQPSETSAAPTSASEPESAAGESAGSPAATEPAAAEGAAADSTESAAKKEEAAEQSE